MESKHWKLIQLINQGTTGIPPNILDIIAVKDILYHCVCGYSVEDISVTLDMDESYILEVIKDFLNFSGWEKSLRVSPYRLYRTSSEDIESFRKTFTLVGQIKDREIISSAYTICYRYDKLKEELQKYGYDG